MLKTFKWMNTQIAKQTQFAFIYFVTTLYFIKNGGVINAYPLKTHIHATSLRIRELRGRDVFNQSEYLYKLCSFSKVLNCSEVLIHTCKEEEKETTVKKQTTTRHKLRAFWWFSSSFDSSYHRCSSSRRLSPYQSMPHVHNFLFT